MIGAFDIIERHPDAARVECLRFGKSVDDVGTPAFSWMDAAAIFAAASPGTPLYDQMFPKSAGWDSTNMLLAAVLDALNIIVWQGGKRKKSDFPRPIPRPGVENNTERKFGGTPIEMDEMAAFLDRKRRGVPAAA